MTNETKVDVTLTGDVQMTDWLETVPNPEMPTAPDNVFFRVERGENSNTGKAAFSVEVKAGPDGETHVGEVKGSVISAFNSAISMLGLAKGAIAGETSLKVLFPSAGAGDNNPPAPTLTSDDLDMAQAILDDIGAGFSELEAGEIKVREAHKHIAFGVRDMRMAFDTKDAWGQVKVAVIDKAPSHVKAVLDNRNAVSLYVKFANWADSDLWATIPDDVRTPRTLEKEMGTLYTAIAADFVSVVYGDHAKARKALNMGKGKITNEGLALYLENFATHTRADLKEGFLNLAEALAAAHLGNIEGAEGDLFTVESKDGKAIVKASAVSNSLFGSEGRDELVNAIVKAANGFAASVTVAKAKGEVAADGAKKLAAAINSGNAFSAMSVEDAALHLMNILASRLDDENRDASADDVDAILSFMGER